MLAAIAVMVAVLCVQQPVQSASARDSAALAIKVGDPLAKLDPVVVSKALGFWRGQATRLSKIGKRFPELVTDITIAESELDIAYGDGIRRLDRIMQERFPTWKEVQVQMQQAANDRINAPDTIEAAKESILEIRKRVSVGIPPDIWAVLLASQARFADDPAAEMRDGFVQKVQLEKTKRGATSDLVLLMPQSWVARPPNLPNVACSYQSAAGTGNARLIVTVHALSAEEKDAFQTLGLEEAAKVWATSMSGTVINSDPIVFRGQKVPAFVLKETQSAVDTFVRQQHWVVFIVRDFQIVTLTFGIGSSSLKQEDLPSEAATAADFEKYRPLFRSILAKAYFDSDYR